MANSSASPSSSMMRVPRRLWALAGLSFIGFAVSAWQSDQFYAIRNGTAGFKSLCNISAKMNCDAVMASPYAEFLAGIPLSSFAAGWFVAIFIVALIARSPFWRRDAVRVAFGLTLFSTALSLIYFSVMAMVLQTFCLFCLIVDVINLASLGIVISLKPEGFKQHAFDRTRIKTFTSVIGGSVAAVVLLFMMAFSGRGPSDAEAERYAQKVLSAPPLPVQTEGDFPSFGSKDAPIVINEFVDFQCPACRMAATGLHNLVNRYPGKIRVNYRSMPLDSSCNPQIQQPMHPVACEAARIAVCANKQGKFEEVYSHFFEEQIALPRSNLIDMAASTGANPDQLKACVADPATALALSRDIEEGRQLNIESTPTLFVNGHKIEGMPPMAVWIKIVDKLLAGAGSAPNAK